MKILIAVLLATATSFAGEMPKIGDKAPAFSAPASDGTTVKLADFVGKGNIVLYFYPKDDTPGCTKEACGIRDAITELKDLNAIVFGVSADSIESHKQFIAKYNLPFVLLADTDRNLANTFGVAGRVTFIIDKEGKIAYVNPTVNPVTHAAEIRTALAALEK